MSVDRAAALIEAHGVFKERIGRSACRTWLRDYRARGQAVRRPGFALAFLLLHQLQSPPTDSRGCTSQFEGYFKEPRLRFGRLRSSRVKHPQQGYRSPTKGFPGTAQSADSKNARMVWTARFELATTCAQGRRATRLRYVQMENHALRTPQAMNVLKPSKLLRLRILRAPLVKI